VRDEADQAGYIVERVLENRERGPTLRQQAVLFRTSHHCGPLEVELTRHNIPFVKFGSLKFLDAAHIRDILALLRFVENPRDGIAGFRVMQLIPGIGPVSAQRVLDHMMGAADPIRALLDTPSPTRAADDWGRFLETLTTLRAGRSGWSAELACAGVCVLGLAFARSASFSHRPHRRCGTGIWPDRDIAAGRRQMTAPRPSVATARLLRPAHPREKPGFST
jgi:DNA helicase-2/ATP-dependent DNA helicase PcrA